MKSFIHYPQVFDVVNSIDQIIGDHYFDHVSCTFHKLGQSICINSVLNKDGTVSGNINGNFKYYDFDIKIKSSTKPSIYVCAHKKLLHDQLDTITTIASRLHKNDELCPPHIDNCIVSFSTHYSPEEYSIHGFLGFKNDNSISTLCAISDSRASVALRGFVTEKINILEASMLLSRYGSFFSIRGDVSSFSLQKVKIGGLKKFNNSDAYILIECIKKSIKYGISSKLPNNTKVALLASYSHSKKKPKFIAGIDVMRIGKFTGKVNINGDIEMKSVFSPNSLVTVTLRSCSSIKTKFDNINFGWSLDFNQNL